MTNNTKMIGGHTMLHDKIVFVIGTKTYTVSKSDPRWDTVCALASARNYEEVAKMLSTSRATYIINSVNSILKEDNVDNFKFEECAPGTDKAVSWNGRHIRVSYKGVVLPEILQKRMFQCLEKEGKEVVRLGPSLSRTFSPIRTSIAATRCTSSSRTASFRLCLRTVRSSPTRACVTISGPSTATPAPA